MNSFGALGRCAITILALNTAMFSSAAFEFKDNDAGQLTLSENGTNILTYQYADNLPDGIDPKYIRSTYIHPLYSLDGEALSGDFPADHPHHHGLFWVWPVVKTRGQDTQTWHPADPTLRQHFVKWNQQDVTTNSATLSVQNEWRLAETEVVASETVTLKVSPIQDNARTLDMEVVIDAVGGPLVLQGTPEGNKGYGGLCFRGAPDLTGAKLTSDKGVATEDIVNEPRKWADISTTSSGVTIEVKDTHPNLPLTWLARNSYAGFLNPCWPGHRPTTLQPGKPVTLSYRIINHRGTPPLK